jgi:hypothetical protein
MLIICYLFAKHLAKVFAFARYFSNSVKGGSVIDEEVLHNFLCIPAKMGDSSGLKVGNLSGSFMG